VTTQITDTVTFNTRSHANFQVLQTYSETYIYTHFKFTYEKTEYMHQFSTDTNRRGTDTQHNLLLLKHNYG